MVGRTGQRSRPWWRQWGLLLGSGLLAVLAVGLGVLWWQAPAFYDNIDPESQATATATTRAGILAVFAATIAALGAIVALAETRRANLAAHDRDREADQRERYAKAIDHLGATGADVRIGGIYTLQRIAEDSKRDLPTVIDVLCAFVRGHGQGPEDNSDGALDRHRPPPDVQVALTVIGRVHDAGSGSEVDLAGAHLECVQLVDATLDGADLTGAKLRGANLNSAQLIGAFMVNGDLSGAYLWEADLHGTLLLESNLDGAMLRGANLTATELIGANLADADLAGTDLAGADLAGAKGLTQDQLEAALGDEQTQLPKSLTRPEHWTPRR